MTGLQAASAAIAEELHPDGALRTLANQALSLTGAATVSTLIGILTIPLDVWTDSGALLWIGALLMGFFGAGNFGVVPAYLNERFPTAVRAVGSTHDQRPT